MVQREENHEVYNSLTEDTKRQASAKWTIYLALCCLTACMGSFNFGYNIGALNLPTPIIKDFYARRFDPAFFNDNDNLNKRTSEYNLQIDAPYNTSNETHQQHLIDIKTNIDLERERINLVEKEIDNQNTFLWALTNSLFVFGGMFGAFSSKYVLEIFGRKKGILFHYIFSALGGILVLLAPQFTNATFAIGCVMTSRFLYGVQGGMMCGIIPTYLNEVSPAALRGSCGVLNQLCITIGILVAQTLGFRQLLGTKDTWEFILAFPLVVSLLGGFIMLFFFSETPKALLITNKDEDATRLVLQRLRNRTNVDDEIEELSREAKQGNSSEEAMSFKELFQSKQLRMSLITSLVLQLTQQLCGINAIFFYSDGIFRRASIADEHIQYAIFATGFINVVCTIAVVPLIEKLGRKPLLVYPMVIMVIDFFLLTACMLLQSRNIVFSYLSIGCIILFICCFAVGLGPIPFIYATEVFPQEARGAALAVCMTLNWIANLILSLSFEYLVKYLADFTFLVFAVIVGFAVIFLFKKLPETKNKSIDEILAFFNGRTTTGDEETTMKPMLVTSKV
jgi:SP family facilitated glucose transporter-like MFS transporter 1